MMLKNPELPATSKQLWLLHILTKTDTRELKLTMAEASERIEQLKNKTAIKSTAKTEKPKQAENDNTVKHIANFNGLLITSGQKTIAKHDFDGETGFSISTTLYGLFPGGKKIYQLSWYTRENRTAIFNPLFGHIRNSIEVDILDVKNLIRSLPIKHKTFETWPEYNLAENIKPIAEQKAQLTDSGIDIYYLTENGEYKQNE